MSNAKSEAKSLIKRLASVNGQTKVDVHLGHTECQALLTALREWASGKNNPEPADMLTGIDMATTLCDKVADALMPTREALGARLAARVLHVLWSEIHAQGMRASSDEAMIRRVLTKKEAAPRR